MSVATSVSYIDISNNEPDSIQARVNTKIITIPASVVEISGNSFENSIVESIIFTDDSQLKTIGKAAFKNCKFLKSIQIPPSVMEIADEAFFDSSLEVIVFTHDSQLKAIGNDVFRDCKFLKSITIPDSVTHIGVDSFRNSTIEKVLFGENSQCTTIGQRAFLGCYFLKSIEIPFSVLKIEDSAFSESNIQTIIFSDHSRLEIIGQTAFYGCCFLKSIEIPSSVLKIEDAAFSESDIHTLIFTDDSRLETIGEFVFENCKSLESIKIPSSVVAIGYAAFAEATIKEIIFSDDSKLEILSERIFEKCPSLKSITIPASILEIGEFAFSESGIEQVLFTDNSNLKTIGKGAFYQSRLSKSMKIPDSVTHIGESSFINAPIEEVLFGANSQCTTIGKNAFLGCYFLKSIEIPSSILKIEDAAFTESNIQTIIFTDNSRLETIGEFVFERCTSLESIKIPSSVIAIGYAAFSESTIKEVIFSDDSKFEILSEYTFMDCPSLKSITIPASILEIGESAFSESGIEEVFFSDNSNLKTIGKGAFQQTRLSKSIQIPMSVVEIGACAFKQCTKLEEVIFSVNSRLETIGKKAFLDCSSLKSFNFPQSLREIGRFAFSLCSLPKSITLLSTSVEFLGDPFTNSGVDEIIFGNSGKTYTTEKNNHFLQLCEEGDLRKCKEHLEHNDVNLSYTKGRYRFSVNFTDDAISSAMTKKNVDLITFLIKNKVLMYSNYCISDIKKWFTDDIFQRVFFESAIVFWYSIFSFAMRKRYKLIRRLLKLFRSKEYFEEWVSIFKNFHQITLRLLTQSDSLDIYHFFIDYDLIKVADLELKTIEKYYRLASQFGYVAILKKSLEILHIENVSYKFTDFLMHAPQDNLYSMIEYTLPYIMKNKNPLGLIIEGRFENEDDFVAVFPETVLSYLAYAQAFDAFKYIIENVSNTQYTPSHLVACSLFRGYDDAKEKGNVDISNFMKLFNYILQDNIRPHVLGEDKEWIGKSIFTCIRFGSSEMCMKLFSCGFDKDDISIEIISAEKRNSLIRYSLLSCACQSQPLEVVQYLIDIGVNIDGLLPNHTNYSNDSNKDDQKCINTANEDEEDGTETESKSEDKYMSDDDIDDDDSDDDLDDTTNPERFLFWNYDKEGAWFEPYFNPYRLNKNQDVDIHYASSRLFDPSTEDPLERFMHTDRGERLTLLNVTPLGAAIDAQNLDLVRLLLKNGANPNAKTFSGFPPLFVLGVSDVIDLDDNYDVRSPEVEYPIIEVSNDIEGKKEEEQMEEQEKGKKMKMEHKSEGEDVSVSIPAPDKKFAIFQELVNHGADLFHKQTVYYDDHDVINSKKVDIYKICSQLKYSLNLLKYLQKIPQLGDKIKKHYIDSFRPSIVQSYSSLPLFAVDTVDYMFKNGYLHFETYKEDDTFRRCIQFERNQDLKLVLEKYGFHFANLSNETM